MSDLTYDLGAHLHAFAESLGDTFSAQLVYEGAAAIAALDRDNAALRESYAELSRQVREALRGADLDWLREVPDLAKDNAALREALSVFVKYGDMVSSMGSHRCLFCGMYGHPVIEHADEHVNGGVDPSHACPVPAARKLVEEEG